MFLNFSTGAEFVEGALIKKQTIKVSFVMISAANLGHPREHVYQGIQAILLVLFCKCDDF